MSSHTSASIGKSSVCCKTDTTIIAIHRVSLSMADISFLLPFLRVRYFSQLEALKLLDNFMTRRAKFPKWFRNLDPGDPKIQDIYDRGYVSIYSLRQHRNV